MAKADLETNYGITDDTSITHMLADVEVACSSAVDILNDMLSADRLESGALVLNSAAINIAQFVTECVKLFSIHCRQKNIDLNVNFDVDEKKRRRGALPIMFEDKLIGDHAKLERVIRTLISNAISTSHVGSSIELNIYYIPKRQNRSLWLPGQSSEPATPDSYNRAYRKRLSVQSETNQSDKRDDLQVPQMRSEFSLKAPSEVDENNGEAGAAGIVIKLNEEAVQMGRLIIQCVDHGSGLSAKDQASLFQGAGQLSVDKLKAGGGMGYGMYISKGIAELHGGTLSVFSRGVGQGSTFTLELPMCREGITELNDIFVVERRLFTG